MKANRIYNILCCALLVCMALAACDPVADSERYQYLGEAQVDSVGRTVLLEEFTGQNCSNCPSAHRVIETLQQTYADRLICVSIHAGDFALYDGQLGSYPGLRTTDGDAYANAWGVDSYPCGVVDRCTGLQNHSQWATSVYARLQEPTDVSLALDASLADGVITVESTIESQQSQTANLQLWVVEDSIVSYQLDGSTPVLDYEHNNVYRASINGTQGSPISMAAGEQLHVTHSIEVGTTWTPANLRVVGFAYDNSGVLQAAQTRITIKK